MTLLIEQVGNCYHMMITLDSRIFSPWKHGKLKHLSIEAKSIGLAASKLITD